MAVKLLTHLAGGPWAAAFQAAMSALPQHARHRLQVCDMRDLLLPTALFFTVTEDDLNFMGFALSTCCQCCCSALS
jgi:hypothetical protein